MKFSEERGSEWQATWKLEAALEQDQIMCHRVILMILWVGLNFLK